MLRVTVDSEPDLITLKLEGKLASLWVHEATKCAEEIVATVRSQTVAVDLSGVTLIDEPGKRLLAGLASRGVRLIADDPVMDEIVNEIVVRKIAPPSAMGRVEAACTRG